MLLLSDKRKGIAAAADSSKKRWGRGAALIGGWAFFSQGHRKRTCRPYQRLRRCAASLDLSNPSQLALLLMASAGRLLELLNLHRTHGRRKVSSTPTYNTTQSTMAIKQCECQFWLLNLIPMCLKVESLWFCC